MLCPIGTASLAGCSSSTSNSGGDAENGSDRDTKGTKGSVELSYVQEDKKSMLLTASDFPDDWKLLENTNDNSEIDLDRTFTNSDETAAVMCAVNIHSTIGMAKEDYNVSKAGVAEPHDYPLADEAFWATRNDSTAGTLWRHSNAEGQVLASKQVGVEVKPAISRSQKYAADMFEKWR